MRKEFTLAEGATHAGIAANLRKCGFTLAEVLITLSVIGIVSALTIPELVKNMNNYAFGKSKEVTLAKITEATNEMKSNDVLSGYTSNDAFVSEFQKYMKVTKRCDSSTIANCFAPKIKTTTGTTVDTTTLTTGTTLGANNISGNTIAMMLANGTTMLFTLRDATKVGTSCDRIDPVDNHANTTGCLSFLYDINGFAGPNIMGKDIATVNATVSTCDGAKVGALCLYTEDLVADSTYSYIASGSAAYNDLKDRGLITQGNSGFAQDYWAGAVYACDQKGMRLPTKDELNAIYKDACGGSGVCKNPGQRTTKGFTADIYWSSTECNALGAWFQDFGFGTQYSDNAKSYQGRVRCVK